MEMVASKGTITIVRHELEAWLISISTHLHIAESRVKWKPAKRSRLQTKKLVVAGMSLDLFFSQNAWLAYFSTFWWARQTKIDLTSHVYCEGARGRGEKTQSRARTLARQVLLPSVTPYSCRKITSLIVLIFYFCTGLLWKKKKRVCYNKVLFNIE